MKRGIDQITAWLIATALAGTTIGIGYGVARVLGKSQRSHAGHGPAVLGDGMRGHANGHNVPSNAGEHDGEPVVSEQATNHPKAASNPGHDASVEAAQPASGSDARGKSVTNDRQLIGKSQDPVGSHDEQRHGSGLDGASRSKSLGARDMNTALADVPWDYRGSTGPEYWGELSTSYALCKSGKRQSPIDIDKSLAGSKLLPIRWHYEPGPVELSYNGRLLTLVSQDPSNCVDIEGERYQFARLDVHAPSEHKISGLPYDLELALLHKDNSGNLATINVLVEEGAANAGLEELVSLLPMQGDRAELKTFALTSLLPKQRTYYRYDGSLTTPPCREGVIQLVMTRTIEASSKQIDALVSMIGFNARPTQPMRGRQLLKSAR